MIYWCKITQTWKIFFQLKLTTNTYDKADDLNDLNIKA